MAWVRSMREPDLNARKEIFNVHMKAVKGRLDGVDAQQLAAATQGMVGADIREIVRQATAEAFHEYAKAEVRGDFVVRAGHFSKALETMLANKRSKRK